jgi:hypothetical protein
MQRSFRKVFGLMLSLLATAVVVGCAAAPTEQPREKIRVTKLDELPQHTYPVTGKVADLVRSNEQIAKLAAKVRADVEADLATYDVDDETTLQRWYGTLLTVDLLEGKDAAALQRTEQIRALETKEAAKLTIGLLTSAMIDARREAGADVNSAQFKQAFRRHLAERVNALPWDIVQDEIQEAKGRLEIFSENLLMGVIQARMEPVVAQTGELNADQAAGVLGIHFTIMQRLPLKDDIVAVYQDYIDAHRTAKENIWPARSVTLADDEDFTPVMMAVWDSGTDEAVFSDRLFVNEAETLDGQDNDGNGYVDDIHGIAYDIHAMRTTGSLCPIGDVAGRISQVMEHMKGFMDLQADVDSPEASALKRHLASLDPQDVKGFIEDLGLAGNYAHGTHVAGIMTEGNPFARLLIARLSYDHRMIPVARTVEWGARDGDKCRDTVNYFKQHGVRVVNMSWGEALEDAEDSLEANGIGENAEERREIARKVFNLQKEGLYEAIAGAPDILFIGAAGNADNDVEFDDYIPSSFDLPNLLIVGAVDQAGEPTSFTSFGRTVRVYANGFEVESYVPGGERMKMSGTSMASPSVANLAGKLLAIDPTLSPPEVIELILDGADHTTAGDVPLLLLNPQRSAELLQERL